MKRIINFLLCIIMAITSLSTVVFAKTGDVIGYAKYSDISAYINHYPIASYNINGYTAIVVEDLQRYGFNTEWDGVNRTLSVTRSTDKTISGTGTVYKYASKAGQNSFAYVETDIVTYVNGLPVESFNIDGRTCIYMDALAPYGEVVWAPEVRAIKLWISDLPMKDYAPLKDAADASVPTTTVRPTYVPHSTPKLTREEIEVRVKPSGSELIFENRSAHPYSFDIISVNGGLVSDFSVNGRKVSSVTVNPGEVKQVDCVYGVFKKGANNGVNSYGYVVISWQGQQYYMDFTVNGITVFYKGNARGPAN